MTIEFIFFADLVLLLRLRLLLADASVGWASWIVKGVVELFALALFVPDRWLLIAAAGIAAVNVLSGFSEKSRNDRNGARLLLGVLELAILSVIFSIGSGVRFRPELAEVGNWLSTWSAFGFELRLLTAPAGLKMLLGVLIAANEANLFVRWLLTRLQIKPGNPSAGTRGIDTSEFNRGRVIGLLERVLIYAFVLGGQFGAIGFTLAAKGFTRFKELEDRGFAEYVLIGTLLSSSVAMAAGAWVKFAL